MISWHQLNQKTDKYTSVVMERYPYISVGCSILKERNITFWEGMEGRGGGGGRGCHDTVSTA